MRRLATRILRGLFRQLGPALVDPRMTPRLVEGQLPRAQAIERFPTFGLGIVEARRDDEALATFALALGIVRLDCVPLPGDARALFRMPRGV